MELQNCELVVRAFEILNPNCQRPILEIYTNLVLAAETCQLRQVNFQVVLARLVVCVLGERFVLQDVKARWFRLFNFQWFDVLLGINSDRNTDKEIVTVGHLDSTL